MRSRSILLFHALLFLVSACNTSISRNVDGSYDVETTINQKELQEVISASIADPLVKEMTVSLQTGHVLVSGERQRLNDPNRTDTLTFRLDLIVINGQLSSSISNAQLDGITIEQDRVDHWNQTIANRLVRLSRSNENSTLTSVVITPTSVTMSWNGTR